MHGTYNVVRLVQQRGGYLKSSSARARREEGTWEERVAGGGAVIDLLYRPRAIKAVTDVQ